MGTGCNGSWISLHACIDGCLCYLLTTPHSDRRMGCMPGFLVEEGRGMEKLVIVAISLNLITESLLDGWTGNSNDGLFTC